MSKVKLIKVFLTNFRGYQERTEILFDNFNVIVGKNDAGKSTILKALEYFLGDAKPEKKDCNNASQENFFEIELVFVGFENLPIVIDDSNEIFLKDDFLLQEDSSLHIVAKYNCSGSKIKPEYFLKCHYPKDLDEKLIELSVPELKKKLKSENIEPIGNQTKSHDLRKSSYLNVVEKEEKQIPFTSKFEKLKESLPMFFAFWCDRENSQNDEEITQAAKNVIERIKTEKKAKFDELKKLSDELANEMSALGDEVIKTLKENFAEYEDEKLEMNFEADFKKSFIQKEVTSSEVDFAQRGSGFRRMLLFSFFLNESKRKNPNNKHTIYAFEEPEISQHPNNQKLLVEMMKNLVKESGQVVLTTHSPGIVKMTNVEESSFVIVEKNNKKQTVLNLEKNRAVQKVAELLGVVDFDISDLTKKKIILYVEGKDDILIIKRIAELLKKEDQYLIVPVGGYPAFDTFFKYKILESLRLPTLEVWDSLKGQEILKQKGDKKNRFVLIEEDIQFYISSIKSKNEVFLKEVLGRTQDCLGNKGKLAKNNGESVTPQEIEKLLQEKSHINGIEEFEELFKKCEETIKTFKLEIIK